MPSNAKSHRCLENLPLVTFHRCQVQKNGYVHVPIDSTDGEVVHLQVFLQSDTGYTKLMRCAYGTTLTRRRWIT